VVSCRSFPWRCSADQWCPWIWKRLSPKRGNVVDFDLRKKERGINMASRSQRAQIARETLAILDAGSYQLPDGATIHLAEFLDHARTHSVLYSPDHFSGLAALRNRKLAERPPADTAFEVVNETTLAAASRLVSAGRVLALNFASAKNPGGGFLGGSQAQEESLARASGLYPCIAPMSGMYDTNRKFRSCLYTDHMIYSPDVPVFRDDEDRLLERPYRVSILTAPAVNAGAVRQNEPGNVARIEPVMRARIEKVLTVAVAHDYDTLVLGAWGCGVFKNSPAQVAQWFHDHLTGEGLFRPAFRKVVFAIRSRSDEAESIRPFQELFGI
jgi:uncharacterized protein (TIGR02452 family)